MREHFEYNNTIKQIQNQLITESIRETSNLELLRSEEAVRDVIESYIDRFQVVEGKLFNAANLLVHSRTVIDSSQFNDIFEVAYIDLTALYNDLEMMDNILSLNLQRNKNFYAIFKKKIKDLQQRLSLTRSNIYDTNPSSESFYESFYDNLNVSKIRNLHIDKKTGRLHLDPISRKIHNNSFLIKNISSITYPYHNEDGGVRNVSSYLNSFKHNYEHPDLRDMLYNGLWKEEVICTEIPEMLLDILNDGLHVRSYKGIVSIIDIEFNYPIELNRFDFDVFGENATDIDVIFYKEFADDTWKQLEVTKQLGVFVEGSSEETISLTGSAFDVISFLNILKAKAKFLKIVLNQQSYSMVEIAYSEQNTLEDKINNDLSERRYDLIKFGSNLDDMLTKPINDDNVSLYSQIINIIESTKNIEIILERIEKLLRPIPDIIEYDFNKALKYEIGAWSIEPIYEKYTPVVGAFDSVEFKLKDKSLISASLITSQETPDPTTCNWYINIKGTKNNIPIVENEDFVRKELMNPVDMSQFGEFSSWTGTFVALDLPVDPSLLEYISIFENGTEINNIPNIAYLNSKLLYFDNITNINRSNFTIKYPVARHKSVYVYVPSVKPGIQDIGNFPLGLISLRKDILRSFMDSTTVDGILFSELYSIKTTIATKSETDIWFPNYTACIFMDSDLYTDWWDENKDNWDVYKHILVAGTTKLKSTYDHFLDYSNNEIQGYSDLNLISSIRNLGPFGDIREID